MAPAARETPGKTGVATGFRIVERAFWLAGWDLPIVSIVVPSGG